MTSRWEAQRTGVIALEEAIAMASQCKKEKSESLVLSQFGLTFVPRAAAEVENLKELRADYNQIETFPVEMCDRHSLRTLSLSYNCITQVPKRIGDLRYLRDLRLGGNQI